MTGEQLHRHYLELCSNLVKMYEERGLLWSATPEKAAEAMEKCDGNDNRGLEELNERISWTKERLGKLREVAKAINESLKLEVVAEECGLSEIEKDMLIVLLMKDAEPRCSGRQTYPTAADLLRLFYRYDFEILEARRLLYPDARLRRNNLLIVEDYAESVLCCTFRLAEQTIRRLLEHDV